MFPKRRFALLLGLLLLSTVHSAQVCRPDRLDGGPCCVTAQPDVPRLRNFKHQARDICWKDCDIEQTSLCNVRWQFPSSGSPTTPFDPCAPQLARIRMTDAAGALKWSGSFYLTYSRTWDEIDAAGNRLQVWRFLVNGNLRPMLPAAAAPCPLPPCAAAFNNTVRYTGYYDLARECQSGARSHAWMLTHACDRIDHAPGFPRAGVFHPDRSYTFVGPAAGFVPGPIQPVAGGASGFEAARRVNLPMPGAAGFRCEFEEVLNSNLTPVQQFCLCSSLIPGVPQWVISDFAAQGACGTSLVSGTNLLPGDLSMGIGTWTLAGTYPGVEALRYNAASYRYDDPCTGVARDEVFFGVTTLGGLPAFQNLTVGGPAIALPLIFIDQANAVRNGQTVMNIRYLSDHILNLNY